MKKLAVYTLLIFVLGCSKSENGFAPGFLATTPGTSADPRSCLDLLAQNPSSGIYTIDPDGTAGPKAVIQVYCDMVTQGGGWTLVMKQKSNDGTTLQGDSAYWTNSATASLNDNVANLNTSDQNLVSAAFMQIPVTQMMLAAANESTTKSQVVSAASAFAAFSLTPSDFADDANANRPNWNVVTTTYPNGNAITDARFGFNMRQQVGSSTYCAVRWGWTANQDAAGSGLGSSDSCGGLGAYGTQYGSSFMNSSKNAWQLSTMLLYVK